MYSLIIFRILISIFISHLSQDDTDERFKMVKFLTENYSKEWILGSKTNVMGINKCKGTYNTYTFNNSNDIFINGCKNNQPINPQKYAWSLSYDNEQKEWQLSFNNKKYRIFGSTSNKFKKQKMILMSVRNTSSDVVEKINLYYIMD